MSHDALEEVKLLMNLLYKKQREIDLLRAVLNEARELQSAIDAVRSDLGTSFPRISEAWVNTEVAIHRYDSEWSE